MRKNNIRWTRTALRNLDAILEYLAENADVQTMEMEAARIWNSVRRLEKFPESGRPGRVPMTRELIVPPYVIPYRVSDDVVEILFVFHSSQKK